MWYNGFMAIKVYPNVTKESMGMLMAMGKIKPCSWVQEIGAVPAKPAGELAQGDMIVYNYGYTSEVLSATRHKSAVIVVTRTMETMSGVVGKTYERKYKATTLIPVAV